MHLINSNESKECLPANIDSDTKSEGESTGEYKDGLTVKLPSRAKKRIRKKLSKCRVINRTALKLLILKTLRTRDGNPSSVRVKAVDVVYKIYTKKISDLLQAIKMILDSDSKSTVQPLHVRNAIKLRKIRDGSHSLGDYDI